MNKKIKNIMNIKQWFHKKPQPLTWDNITVGQFKRINQIVEDKTLNEMDKTFAIYNIVTGEDGHQLKFATFLEKLEPIKQLLGTQLPERKLKKKYNINGVIYKPMIDASVLTAGQYFDYYQLISTKEFGKILSIFLVPEGHYYNDNKYDLNEAIENIENYLPITELNSLIFFFKAKVKTYARRFLGYSTMQIIKLKALKWSEKKQIIHSIKATLKNMVY